MRAGVPYVYGAVNGWVAQAAVSLPGDRLVETIYPEGAVLKNKSVLSFPPALCASMQVSSASSGFLAVRWKPAGCSILIC